MRISYINAKTKVGVPGKELQNKRTSADVIFNISQPLNPHPLLFVVPPTSVLYLFIEFNYYKQF